MTSIHARILLLTALASAFGSAAWACSMFGGNASPTSDPSDAGNDSAATSDVSSADAGAPVDATVARPPWLVENFDEQDGVINSDLVRSITVDDASTVSITDAEAFSAPNSSLSYVGTSAGHYAWYGATFPNASLDGGVFTTVSIKAKINIAATEGDLFYLAGIVVPRVGGGNYQWLANRAGNNVTITTEETGTDLDGGRLFDSVSPGLTLMKGAGWKDLELTIRFNADGSTTATLTIAQSQITSTTTLALDRTSINGYIGIGACFSGGSSVYLDNVVLDYE